MLGNILDIIKWQNRLIFVFFIVISQANNFSLADQVNTRLNNCPSKSDKAKNSLQDYQRIKQAPVDFPNLPIFQGKTKFLNGHYLPNKNGVSVCQMQYLAQEKKDLVLNFYKDAFSGNGWKIQFAGGPAISALHNDGHLCSVNVIDSKLPNWKSQITIAYRQLTK